MQVVVQDDCGDAHVLVRVLDSSDWLPSDDEAEQKSESEVCCLDGSPWVLEAIASVLCPSVLVV